LDNLPEDWTYKLELEKMKIRRDEIELKRDEMRIHLKLIKLQLNANATVSNLNSNQLFHFDTAAKMLPKLATEHDSKCVKM